MSDESDAALAKLLRSVLTRLDSIEDSLKSQTKNIADLTGIVVEVHSDLSTMRTQLLAQADMSGAELKRYSKRIQEHDAAIETIKRQLGTSASGARPRPPRP